MLSVIRERLFADDCAIMAHTIEHIQLLTDCFAKAAKRFGLKINLKKTEVLFQSTSFPVSYKPTVTIDNTPLNVVDKFCYLGSVLSRNADISDDIGRRIGAACAAFGKLEARLWKSRDIKLATKVAVYKAVVLPTLLHGCESWTLYRRHIHSLDKFHLRCLLHIARIKWQDKVPNTDVLKRCKIIGIEAMIMRSQLRWAGHLTRMPDRRIPKIVFYSELQHGARPRGRPKMRYKDNLKANLLSAGIDTNCWESAASSRTTWRSTCFKGVSSFEEQRIDLAIQKRHRRKDPSKSLSTQSTQLVCAICERRCSAKIGLMSHMRTHNTGSRR